MQTTPPSRRIAAAAFVSGIVATMCVVTPRQSLAQSGATITGVVTTSESHTPVFGARVAIEQPPRVAGRSDRGTYTLRDMPAGS